MGLLATLEVVVSEGPAEMMLRLNDKKEKSDEYKKEGTRWKECSGLRCLSMLLSQRNVCVENVHDYFPCTSGVALVNACRWIIAKFALKLLLIELSLARNYHMLI